MKKGLLSFLMLGSLMTCPYSYGYQWSDIKGDHFIVHYTDNKDFAEDCADKAEVYYKRIAEGLGYPRYKEFWTWDNRVKIYIYPNQASYLKATHQPAWSHGMAEYKSKEIHSFAGSDDFLVSILPHEIAHLIFRDFVGFKGEVPLWLDEGVAQWAEEEKRQKVRNYVKRLYEEETLLTLDDMMKLDVRTITVNSRIYIRSTFTKTGEKAPLILGADNLVNSYYVQAVSLVDFLIEKFGSTSFAVFCRELRDGKSLEDALRSAYPAHIQNLDEMERQWRKYLSELP